MLIVEHHGYFRNGVQTLTAFIREIKRLGIGIEWLTLETALEQSAKYKLVGNLEYEVQFVTSIFRLRNPLDSKCRFRCWKSERDPGEVLEVKVDGENDSYIVEGDRIYIVVEVDGGAERTIKVEYKLSKIEARKMPLAYQGRVCASSAFGDQRQSSIEK